MSTPTQNTTTPAKKSPEKKRKNGILSQAIGDLPEAIEAAQKAEKNGDGLRISAENLLAEIEAAGMRLKALLAFK